MALNRPPRDALMLLGYIQAAVHDPLLGGSLSRVTQNVYESYRQRYLAQGEAAPTIPFGSLNQEIGIAFAQRRAQLELQAARSERARTGNDIAITRAMMAPSFRAELGAQPEAGSRVQIRYSYLTGDPSLPVEKYRTYIPGLGGPASLNELEDLVDQDAIANSENYGEFYLERTDYLSIEFY